MILYIIRLFWFTLENLCLGFYLCVNPSPASSQKSLLLPSSRQNFT